MPSAVAAAKNFNRTMRATEVERQQMPEKIISPEGGVIEDDDDFVIGSTEGVELDPWEPPLESPTLPDDQGDDRPTYLDDDEPPFDPAADPDEDDDDYEDVAAKGPRADDDDDSDPVPSSDPLAEERAALAAERAQMQRDRIISQAQNDIQVAKAHRDAADLAMTTVNSEIKATREAMAAAREAGDTYREIELQGALEDLRSAQANIQNRAGQIPTDDMIKQHADHALKGIQQPQQKQHANIQPLTGLAGKWATNNAWMKDRRFGKETETLIEINNQLVKENFDENSPEFYSEITRRMARAFPQLRVKGLDGRTAGVRKSSPSSGMRVANPRSSARRTTPGSSMKDNIKLNSDDLRMARELGIDLKDKEMVSELYKNKSKRVSAQAARRR